MAAFDDELGPDALALIEEFGRTLTFTLRATAYDATTGDSASTIRTTFDLVITAFFEDTDEMKVVDMSTAREATAFSHNIFTAAGVAGSASLPGTVEWTDGTTGHRWLVRRASPIAIVDTAPLTQVWLERA